MENNTDNKDLWMDYDKYKAIQKFRKEKESLVYPQWLKIFCDDTKDMKK